MKILVTNHWLKKLGGSETFTYTLIAELKKQGHDVQFFTFHKGSVSSQVEKNLGCKYIDLQNVAHPVQFDLILANHHTTVAEAFTSCEGFIIQTCHGTIPKLEQPSAWADSFVGISNEVRMHLKSKGFPSVLILNGIDCERFTPKRKINTTLQNVLSLSHSDKLNKKLAIYFSKKGINFICHNKYTNPTWNIEQSMNNADLVISLGRGCYEAMACGRPVLVLDHRPYQAPMGDGLLLPENIDKIIKNNCSGRTNKYTDIYAMLDAALVNYNQKLSKWAREYALENLNITLQVKKYISIYENRK